MSDYSAEPQEQSGIDVPGESQAQPTHTEHQPSQHVESQSEAGGDDVETRAKAMGWVPKEEYRGPPDNWRDAAEFVRRGEEELPIVRERNRDLTRKLSDVEQRLANLDRVYQQKLEAVDRMGQVALQRQRDQLVGTYETALRDAVMSGDTDRYDKLRQDYGQALNNFDTQVHRAVVPQQQQPTQAPRITPEDAAEISGWERANPWYHSDQELNLAAQHHHMRIQREKPHLSTRENLAEVAKAVKAQYADRFGMAQRAPAVESGSGARMAMTTSRGKGASDLPAEVRSIAERYVRDGLFKDVNEYARDYFAQG